MARKRPVWQRLVAMLLCLVFVCAFYGSLTVQAVFGVDDIVIGGALVASAAVLTYITVVGLSGSDLAQPLYDAANRANTNINDWLEPKVTAFLEATDGTTLLDTQIKSLVGGLSYAKNGVLYFSDALGNFIHDFGEWLIDNGYISVSNTGGSIEINEFSDLSSVLNFPVYLGYLSANTYDRIDSGSDHWRQKASVDTVIGNYKVSSGSAWFSVMAADRAFSYGRSWNSDNFALDTASYTYTKDGKSVYYMTLSGSNSGVVFQNGNVVNSLKTSNLSLGLLAWAMVYGATSTGATSGLDVWNQDTTDGFAVDPTGVIGGSIADADVPAGAIAGVGDYLQAIADAIAGIADITLPVAGVGDIAIDPAVPADVSIPVTPAIPADRADAVPSTGEATPAYPATGDYTLPLADFFPFCIPFDIYKMLSLLSASPEAPSFTWQFYTPGGGSVPIEVDLSQFDTVASVLRAVETLAFCVGLGFVTKKLLFGS